MQQATLSIRTFGPFQVHLDNVLLQWPTQKSRLLLQILLLEPGVIVNSERIMDLLWPDLPPGSAKSNLWVTVSQLRRVLEPNLPSRGHSKYIHKAGDGYRFNRDTSCQLDSDLFTTLLNQAKNSGSSSERLQLWEKAAQLYTGDYLAEEIYAEWLFSNRYQWQQSYLQILTALSETYMKVGDLSKAISYCRQYLEYDDISETISRMLMYCLNQQGERSAALTYYQQLTIKLAHELGVEPLLETRELAQQIKDGKSAAPGSSRLHTQTSGTSSLTPLVGRESQLAQLTNRWSEIEQGHGHIMLVTGEAGVGKSRLAQELAALATHQSAHVLQTRCYEIEQGLAYQPLIDLLQQAVAQGTRSEQLATVWQRELAVIMPDFKDSIPSVVVTAGHHDLSVYALSQAITHFQNALSLSREPGALIEAYYGLGRGYMLLEASEESAAHFRQGIAIALRQEDLKAEARLLYGLAVNLSRRHRPDASITDIENALAAAQKAEDDHLIVQCLLLLTEAQEANGDLISALKTISRAESLSRQMAYPILQSQSLLESAFLNTLLSNFSEAIKQTKQALNLPKAPLVDASEAYAWNILGRAYGGNGSYTEALDAFARCHTIASRMGDGYLLSMIPNMRGWLHRELGDFTAALAYDEEGVRLAQQWGKSPPEISARLNICHDLLTIGKIVEAKQMLADVGVQFESVGFHRWRWRLRWNYIYALCHLTLGDYLLVQPLIQDGLELATQHSVTKYLALNHSLAGELAGYHGQLVESEVAWQKAVEIADQIGLQPIRWQGRLQLAKILQRRGQKAESEQLLLAAESITNQIASGLTNLHLENSFRQLVATHRTQ